MKIWIDLDNTPHVPFFRPIIRELEARGHTVVLTARDAFQVCALADLFGLRYRKVGRHYGKNRVMKIVGLLWRTAQLLPFMLRERPDLALSHGSRSQILLSNLLCTPTVMVMDYEHARTPWLLRPRWEIVPTALANEDLQCKTRERVLTYEGIKEDVYAPEFKPVPGLLDTLGVAAGQVVVTVRPPAGEAHYHRPESDTLFAAFMNRVCESPGVTAVLLPRNKLQEEQLRRDWPGWFSSGRVVVPKTAMDGLNLLWHSDFVVSGGGTMNREAAALGVPVYSVFRGQSGAVDRQLQAEGRLVLIETLADVAARIPLQRRERGAASVDPATRRTLVQIMERIGEVLLAECVVEPGRRMPKGAQ